MASSAEAFTFIDGIADWREHDEPTHLFDKFSSLTSAKIASPFTQLLVALRAAFPEYVVTFADLINLNLLAFAAAGHATLTLDTDTDSVLRMRYWLQPGQRGGIGHLGDSATFAKYHYRWGNEDYMVYVVLLGFSAVQFILKERAAGEDQLSNSAITDSLLTEVGRWQYADRKGIWVYDFNRGWYLDVALYDQVENASWDKVILDAGMKKELKSVSRRFFDSKNVYKDLGVPWKRGLIFYGPPGNGKTISIKALMHTLGKRKEPIPTLYVKAAPTTFHIRNVFYKARQMSPCLLVLEDIDTIVSPLTRSYFYNEVDGLENNDGILMVASTNHIDKLDPGLSKRPSRFDRKYLFPKPSKAERIQYVQFWRRKLDSKPDVEFPELLVEPIADITPGFSFAYIQEAFVATLLEMAHRRDDIDDSEDDDDEVDGDGISHSIAYDRSRPVGTDDPENYELWRVMKQQVKMLRDEMDESVETGTAGISGLTLADAETALIGASEGSGIPALDADADFSRTNPHRHLEQWAQDFKSIEDVLPRLVLDASGATTVLNQTLLRPQVCQPSWDKVNRA